MEVAIAAVAGERDIMVVRGGSPVVPPDLYKAVRFGPKTAGKVVRKAVLELTYTTHDMAPFARDMGYADASGKAKPPLRAYTVPANFASPG